MIEIVRRSCLEALITTALMSSAPLLLAKILITAGMWLNLRRKGTVRLWICLLICRVYPSEDSGMFPSPSSLAVTRPPPLSYDAEPFYSKHFGIYPFWPFRGSGSQTLFSRICALEPKRSGRSACESTRYSRLLARPGIFYCCSYGALQGRSLEGLSDRSIDDCSVHRHYHGIWAWFRRTSCSTEESHKASSTRTKTLAICSCIVSSSQADERDWVARTLEAERSSDTGLWARPSNVSSRSSLGIGAASSPMHPSPIEAQFEDFRRGSRYLTRRQLFGRLKVCVPGYWLRWHLRHVCIGWISLSEKLGKVRKIKRN